MSNLFYEAHPEWDRPLTDKENAEKYKKLYEYTLVKLREQELINKMIEEHEK